MAAVLSAELVIRPLRAMRPEDLVATCSLMNAGDEPVDLGMAPLSSPSLCLELEDANGSPFFLPPPPVPGGPEEISRLEPGERVTVEHRAFLPSWAPPGRYQARLHYVRRSQDAWSGELRSGWTTFETGA